MPIRAFLAMHVSVCLLITTTCSAVFARFGWLNRFGTADRSVFCLRGDFCCSRAYLPPDRTAPRNSRRWWVLVCRTMFLFADVFVCFVVPDVLRTAVASVCWSGGFLFWFWAADQTNWTVDGVLPVVVFIRFSRRCVAIFAFFLTDCCVLFRLLAHIWLCFCLFSLGFLCFP